MADIDTSQPSYSPVLNNHIESDPRTTTSSSNHNHSPKPNQEQNTPSPRNHHHHHHDHGSHQHRHRKHSSGGFLIEPRRRSLYNGSPFFTTPEEDDKKSKSRQKGSHRDFSGSSQGSHKHRTTQSTSSRALSGTTFQPSLNGTVKTSKRRPDSLRMEDERLKELLAKATQGDAAWVVGMANSLGKTTGESRPGDKNAPHTRGSIPEFDGGDSAAEKRRALAAADERYLTKTVTRSSDDALSFQDNYTLTPGFNTSGIDWKQKKHVPKFSAEVGDANHARSSMDRKTNDLSDTVSELRYGSTRDSLDVTNSDRYSSKRNSVDVKRSPSSIAETSSPDSKRNEPRQAFGTGVLESVVDNVETLEEEDEESKHRVSRHFKVHRTDSADTKDETVKRKPAAARGFEKLKHGATKVRSGVGSIVRHKKHTEEAELSDVESAPSSDEDELPEKTTLALPGHGYKDRKSKADSLSSIEDGEPEKMKKKRKRFSKRLQPFTSTWNGNTSPPPPLRTSASLDEERVPILESDKEDMISRQVSRNKDNSKDRDKDKKPSRMSRLVLPSLQTSDSAIFRGRSPARHVVIESMADKAKKAQQEEDERRASQSEASDRERSRAVSPRTQSPVKPTTTKDITIKPSYRRDLLRLQTAMLSTGILARAIGHPNGITPSRFHACARVVDNASSNTTMLSKSITEKSQALTENTQAFQSSTVTSLRKQIVDVQRQITDDFTPAIQTASDQADDLNGLVNSAYTLEVKKLAEQGDTLLRRQGRATLWMSRWVYLGLEWLLLGIMWIYWFVFIVVRIFRVTVGSVFKAIRWLLWI